MTDQGQGREAAIDHLYALPLDEFTAARDELARRLRREGDGDAGAEAKRLRKPSVAAWALNQVRRNNPEQSDKLIEAGRRLREGQERLLEGGGREPFQRAAADERRLVGELAGHAEHELVAAGRSVSAAVQEKVRATLHAVAGDPEAREEFAAGRLVRDHEATGLGPLAGGTPASGAGAAAGRRRKEPSAKATVALARRARKLEERLERARERQRELDEKSADAGRRLREARRDAERAAAAVERAEAAEKKMRERAETAAEAVVELERKLTATRAG
jgi:hypothetical protein